MKSAANISEVGMIKAYEVISPGFRQCDVVGEIQKALFYGTPEFGGEYASIATLLPTGKGTSASSCHLLGWIVHGKCDRLFPHRYHGNEYSNC